MTRSAAAKADAAADAVLAWLRDQSQAGVTAAPAGRGGGPTEAASAQAWNDGAAAPDASAKAPVIVPPAVEEISAARRAERTEPGRLLAPMRLAHTDWLHHRVTITGPGDQLAAFRCAAAGAGIIPWQLDLDGMEEDLFHLLVSPPPGQPRTLSVAGARVLAGQLSEAVGLRHQRAVGRVGVSHACPFDLHALVPVPDKVLRLGPDDPIALTWLWEHWGTTRALRHVAEEPAASPQGRRRSVPAAARGTMRVNFWSADWTPWRILTVLAERWSRLRFDVRPTYD